MGQLNRRRRFSPGGYSLLADWFVRDVMPTLNATELRVYLTLLRLERTNELPDGRSIRCAFCSHGRMAEFVGVSERSVIRATTTLLERGLIQRINRPRHGEASIYVIPTVKPSNAKGDASVTHAEGSKGCHPCQGSRTSGDRKPRLKGDAGVTPHRNTAPREHNPAPVPATFPDAAAGVGDVRDRRDVRDDWPDAPDAAEPPDPGARGGAEREPRADAPCSECIVCGHPLWAPGSAASCICGKRDDRHEQARAAA